MRRGGWARSGVQQQRRPADANHGETGRYDNGSPLGETLLPLSGGWKGDLLELPLEGVFCKVLHALTCAPAGIDLGGGAAIHQDLQGRPITVREEEVQW